MVNKSIVNKLRLNKSMVKVPISMVVSLKKNHGISSTKILSLCGIIGVNPRIPWRCLVENQLLEIRGQVRSISELSQNIPRKNLQSLIKLKHYVGLRQVLGLPSKGQRTRTNASTAKRLNRFRA